MGEIRVKLKGKVKRASDFTKEEISKMRWEQIQPLIDFEYALMQLKRDREKVIEATNLYQHYLELSEGNEKIARRFFMESGFGAYWEDVCEELEDRRKRENGSNC